MKKHIYDTSKLFTFFEYLKQESEHVPRFKSSFFLFQSLNDPFLSFDKSRYFELKQEGEVNECFFKPIIKKNLDGETETILGGKFYVLRISETDNIWCLVSNQNEEFNSKRIKPFFTYWHSPFTRSFLSSRDIQAIFDGIRTFYHASEIRSIKSIAYSLQNKATIKFDELDYRQLFQDVDEQKSYLSKIKFCLYSKEEKSIRQILKAGISRSCSLNYYEGDINIFFDRCIKSVATYMSNKINLLSNRDRKKYADPVKPIQISFEEDVFKEPKNNNKVISALSGIKHSNFTVYHANPYLHASYLDFKDGSTFDIFVTSSRTINVSPGFKASAAAFSRVINHLFESIKEGKLTPTETPQFIGSLDDFLSGKI